MELLERKLPYFLNTLLEGGLGQIMLQENCTLTGLLSCLVSLHGSNPYGLRCSFSQCVAGHA